MSSLFTDAEKAALQADFQSVIDTFVRPLTVYQDAAQTVVVNSADYNPYTSNNQNSTEITYTPVASTVSGRIMWDKLQELKFVRPEVAAQIKVTDQTARAVRLKVDGSGYALLVNAKRVQIDGVLCLPDSNPRPHGLFAPDYWTFYFVRV